MESLISVIIPVYKVEEYLPKCLDTVLAQTYGNLEIILVDDGSPDNCGKICDEYAVKDSRIKVVHQNNTGLSGARNTGIDSSTGEYLMFVDSDDYIDEHMTEYLLVKSLEYDADITICGYYDVYGNDVREYSYPVMEFVTEGMHKFDHLYDEYAIANVAAWNKLYKRKVFESVRYPVGKINEDEFIICDLLYNADRVCYSLKPFYYYVRSRSDSITNTFNMKKYDVIEAFDKRAEFFRNKGMNELAALTEYAAALLLITRTEEHIQYGEPTTDIIRNKYSEIQNRINDVSKSDNLSLKRKVRMLLFKLIPGLYDGMIRQWLKENE